MNRILLVDDDAIHRMSLRDLLEVEGFLCKEAEDGQEALEYRASGSFDLVISDLYMPKVNGFDLLVFMAKGNMIETTSVIFITGMPDENLRHNVLGLGAAAVLFKPYQLTDLLSIMATTMNRCDLEPMSSLSG